MAIANGIIFLGSVSVLANLYKPKTIDLLLFLSLPCTFYFYIPQTESLFFLFSTLIIYGILREKPMLVFAAIYFATLTRASFLFFIIPFFGITLLSAPKSQVFESKKWLYFIGIYITPIILGVLSVGLLQYLSTSDASNNSVVAERLR